MMGRGKKKIKGLRNYTTLYICTVPRPAYLLYHLLPIKQYYTNHALLITWRQLETNSRQVAEENSHRYISDIALMSSQVTYK